MLIDVSFDILHYDARILAAINPGETELSIKRIKEGLYQFPSFNAHLYMRHLKLNEWPDFESEDGNWFNSYGVCDNPDQFMEVVTPQIHDPDRKFVVTFYKLLKENEPKSGGWRWHKWGPYVGTQDSQCEYLADEPEIEEVWTYHIYEILS